MIAGEARSHSAAARWPAVLVVLAVAALGLALTSALPLVAGASIALGGVLTSALLQLRAPQRGRAVAALPALIAMGALAVTAPIGAISELLAGACGVALLAWLAEDPSRPPQGASRGSMGWALPALAVGLAWVGSFLLPPNVAPIGVAGALLAATVVVIAYLFRRPQSALGPSATTI